jgi:hypothetical protein
MGWVWRTAGRKVIYIAVAALIFGLAAWLGVEIPR